MKQLAVRNGWLALLGLVALSIYVLACTSFSPDDSKVLYPTFDPNTGAVGVSVYDRATGKSELVFLPTVGGGADLETKPVLCRSQWLPDGKSVVVAWPVLNASGEANDDGLNFEVLPFNRPGPARLFCLPALKGGMGQLTRPLAVAGTYLFLTGESNGFVRVDLATGQIRRQSSQGNMALLPASGGNQVFYLAEAADTSRPGECGWLNPETFARTPLFQISSNDFEFATGDFAFSRDGKRLAYFGGNKEKPVLHVLESGQPIKTPLLAAGGETLELGSVRFSPKGDVLYASFMTAGSGKTNTAFGVLEIPLDGTAVRRTILIPNAGKQDETSALLFQLDVAHDGKALAVASTYLAVDHPLKAEDCALFLVDLTDPQRKVTKVRVPQPARTESPSKK